MTIKKLYYICIFLLLFYQKKTILMYEDETDSDNFFNNLKSELPIQSISFQPSKLQLDENFIKHMTQLYKNIAIEANSPPIQQNQLCNVPPFENIIPNNQYPNRKKAITKILAPEDNYTNLKQMFLKITFTGYISHNQKFPQKIQEYLQTINHIYCEDGCKKEIDHDTHRHLFGGKQKIYPDSSSNDEHYQYSPEKERSVLSFSQHPLYDDPKGKGFNPNPIISVVLASGVNLKPNSTYYKTLTAIENIKTKLLTLEQMITSKVNLWFAAAIEHIDKNKQNKIIIPEICLEDFILPKINKVFLIKTYYTAYMEYIEKNKDRFKKNNCQVIFFLSNEQYGDAINLTISRNSKDHQYYYQICKSYNTSMYDYETLEKIITDNNQNIIFLHPSSENALPNNTCLLYPHSIDRESLRYRQNASAYNITIFLLNFFLKSIIIELEEMNTEKNQAITPHPIYEEKEKIENNITPNPDASGEKKKQEKSTQIENDQKTNTTNKTQTEKKEISSKHQITSLQWNPSKLTLKEPWVKCMRKEYSDIAIKPDYGLLFLYNDKINNIVPENVQNYRKIAIDQVLDPKDNYSKLKKIITKICCTGHENIKKRATDNIKNRHKIYTYNTIEDISEEAANILFPKNQEFDEKMPNINSEELEEYEDPVFSYSQHPLCTTTEYGFNPDKIISVVLASGVNLERKDSKDYVTLKNIKNEEARKNKLKTMISDRVCLWFSAAMQHIDEHQTNNIFIPKIGLGAFAILCKDLNISETELIETYYTTYMKYIEKNKEMLKKNNCKVIFYLFDNQNFHTIQKTIENTDNKNIRNLYKIHQADQKSMYYHKSLYNITNKNDNNIFVHPSDTYAYPGNACLADKSAESSIMQFSTDPEALNITPFLLSFFFCNIIIDIKENKETDSKPTTNPKPEVEKEIPTTETTDRKEATNPKPEVEKEIPTTETADRKEATNQKPEEKQEGIPNPATDRKTELKKNNNEFSLGTKLKFFFDFKFFCYVCLFSILAKIIYNFFSPIQST